MTLDRPLAFRLPLLTGGDVRAAQLALIRASALRAEPDGVYGPATRDAVASFQRREGLTSDGVIGPETWSRLSGQPGLHRERPWQEGLRPFLPPFLAWHGPPVGKGQRRWRVTRHGIAIEGEEAPRRSALTVLLAGPEPASDVPSFRALLP